MTKSSHRSSASDMLFGMGGKLLYAATRVGLPPLALAHMGMADYGLWAACFVLVSYLGMAASGFTLVYLRGTAQHHANGDVAAVSRLLSTGMLTMGVLALALLAALGLALPALLELFRVAPDQRALAAQLWLGTAAVFLADMSLGAFGYVLHAVGRIRDEQKTWVFAFLLESVLIVALLQMGLGVHALLLAFALRYLFSVSVNAWQACRAVSGLSLSWRHFDRSLLRSFFGFGAGMQVSGLIASALHSADRLLAGALVGPQATALMDLAGKLPTTAASISSSASTVAVSAAARHDAQGQIEAVQQVYRDASRMAVGSLALTLPFLAWFSEPLTVSWLGADAGRAAAPLMMLLTLGIHLHQLTAPVNAVSRGRGNLGADFLYHGLRLATLGAALLWWHAAQPGTLPALALALALAQGTAAVIYLAQAHRRLYGSWQGLGTLVLVPTLGAHALAAGLSLLLPGLPTNAGRVQALATLVLPAGLWSVCAVLLLGSLLLSRSEQRALAQRVLRVLPSRNQK